MVWIASFGYNSIHGTNKVTMLANWCNFATEAFAFVFLFVCDDIVNARYCTTETWEHTFGGWRCESCEETADETFMIEDKLRCKVNAIFEGRLAVSRDSCSGYQAIHG